jgi:hypothetical protein
VASLPSSLAGVPLRLLGLPGVLLDELRRLNENLVDVVTTLRQIQRPDGPLERLVDVSETLERLADLDDSLRQLGRLDETLEQIAGVSQSLHTIASAADSLQTLADAAGALPELTAAAGRLESVEDLVHRAVGNLESLQPSLDGLSRQVGELHEAVEVLGGALDPLSRLADRVPGGRAARR